MSANTTEEREQTGSSSRFKHATVEVRVQGEAIQTLTLQMGKTYLIGRQPNMAISLDDPNVSRRHASLELRADGLYLTDLDSSNGVTLEGTLVRLAPCTAYRLKPEQSFQVCGYVLATRLGGFSEREVHETQQFLTLLHEIEPDLQVIGQIGSGSTGSVWAVSDAVRQRRIALKVLHSSIDTESTDALRFLQEAKLCQRVNSCNVVEIYDVRLAKNRPMILMELVNGPSARERLRQSDYELPINEVLEIGEDVARGLVAVAHAGLVHRDVKPSNIMISPSGSKLSDFGIAKLLTGPSITESGHGLGTLAYVAPEQALSAKTVDARADLYALGATLYHLLTGSPPFQPKPYPDMFKAILETPPIGIRKRRADVPPSLADLVHALLEKKPEERPQSASVVALELNRLRLEIRPTWGGPYDTERFHLE